MRSYSQNNEQAITIAYFGDELGTYLDIGANDGRTLSNTHALALMGWSGVCVEPSPTAFDKLRTLYFGNGNIECHQVAIDIADGKKILHESGRHIGREDTALLSSLIESETERWNGSTSFKPTSVDCITFATLLERSSFKKFDMISIDAEGMDYAILEQIDLTAVGCYMLIIEWNGKDEAKFTDYCRAHGMKLHAKNGENLIYTR